MMSHLNRNDVERMAALVSWSPLLYALLALLLSKYPLNVDVDLSTMYNGALISAFALLLISRPLLWIIVPPGQEPTKARVGAACLVLAGVGELMAICGVVCVWCGAALTSFIPFFILSALYYVDFRLFRLNRILDMWPGQDDDPDDGPTMV